MEEEEDEGRQQILHYPSPLPMLTNKSFQQFRDCKDKPMHSNLKVKWLCVFLVHPKRKFLHLFSLEVLHLQPILNMNFVHYFNWTKVYEGCQTLKLNKHHETGSCDTIYLLMTNNNSDIFIKLNIFLLVSSSEFKKDIGTKRPQITKRCGIT